MRFLASCVGLVAASMVVPPRYAKQIVLHNQSGAPVRLTPVLGALQDTADTPEALTELQHGHQYSFHGTDVDMGTWKAHRHIKHVYVEQNGVTSIIAVEDYLTSPTQRLDLNISVNATGALQFTPIHEHQTIE